MKKANSYHVSILGNEVKKLTPSKGIVVDTTLGGGGHSKLMFEQLKSGVLVSIDKDYDAIKNSVDSLNMQKNENGSFKLEMSEKKWIIINDTFSNIIEVLKLNNLTKVDFILADLGVSSHQIDERSRGFSFMQVGPLDMRMNKQNPLTAKDLVNGLSKKELEKIFREYGEERYAKEIAIGIINYRDKKQISTTKDIVEIINKVVGYKYEDSKHPARRVFQALRIVVNDELGELQRLCENSKSILNESGVILFLTFHSLERNTIKKYFTNISEIFPTSEEIELNSRSKSCIGYLVK